MMNKLVTLQQAKDHLRVDTSDGDSEIDFLVQAASQAVLNYIDDHNFLDSNGDVYYDSSETPVGVPGPVQAATLILVGQLYTDRIGKDFIDPSGRGDLLRVGNIILPRTVHFLLDPYRLPICF